MQRKSPDLVQEGFKPPSTKVCVDASARWAKEFGMLLLSSISWIELYGTDFKKKLH